MNPNIRYIKRELEILIKSHLDRGKVIILYGARQAGKTTLLQNLFPKKEEVLYLSCEQTRIKEQLTADLTALERIIGSYNNVIMDEAQYLDNPGLVLKILIDSFPVKNFIASGSSSFDLAHKISEPLTGRHYKFVLFPLSLSEIINNTPSTDRKYHLDQSLIFGSYPEVFKQPGEMEKVRLLTLLTDAYLYKDILAFNLVKNNRKVRELLIAISLQIGNEVSYTELANTVGIDRKTVEYYLDLLEKSFVIFRLYGFSRNLRSEINRKVKVYFYDLGVRNALINNYNQMYLRNDSGSIFENYVVSEMVKKEANQAQKANYYFWRTYDQKEIDLLTEKNNIINAYEIKIRPPKKISAFSTFERLYPGSINNLITMDNVSKYL